MASRTRTSRWRFSDGAICVVARGDRPVASVSHANIPVRRRSRTDGPSHVRSASGKRRRSGADAITCVKSTLTVCRRRPTGRTRRVAKMTSGVKLPGRLLVRNWNSTVVGCAASRVNERGTASHRRSRAAASPANRSGTAEDRRRETSRSRNGWTRSYAVAVGPDHQGRPGSCRECTGRDEGVPVVRRRIRSGCTISRRGKVLAATDRRRHADSLGAMGASGHHAG